MFDKSGKTPFLLSTDSSELNFNLTLRYLLFHFMIMDGRLHLCPEKVIFACDAGFFEKLLCIHTQRCVFLSIYS